LKEAAPAPSKPSGGAKSDQTKSSSASDTTAFEQKRGLFIVSQFGLGTTIGERKTDRGTAGLSSSAILQIDTVGTEHGTISHCCNYFAVVSGRLSTCCFGTIVSSG
jgi:hypothetical protein